MISYTTGTINQPDAGSVGQAMAEQIRDDLVAHAAWELVEEVSGTNTYWYVLRCLASASGLPADFFAVIGRTRGNGELRFAIGEDYDSATHVLSHYAHNNVAGVTYDASGRNGTNTFTLGANNFGTSFGDPMYMAWVPSGTSTKWWLTAADDGFTVAFNGASNGFVHLGAYAPLSALPNTMPVCLIGSSGGASGGNHGGITRNPAVAGVNPGNAYVYSLEIEGGGGTAIGNGPILGFRGAFQYNDKLQNNQRPIAEQGINVYQGAADAAQVTGWALGKQKRMRVSDKAMPAGFAFGDAFALDGNLWVPYLPTDGRIWDTGVAA